MFYQQISWTEIEVNMIPNCAISFSPQPLTSAVLGLGFLACQVALIRHVLPPLSDHKDDKLKLIRKTLCQSKVRYMVCVLVVTNVRYIIWEWKLRKSESLVAFSLIEHSSLDSACYMLLPSILWFPVVISLFQKLALRLSTLIES